MDTKSSLLLSSRNDRGINTVKTADTASRGSETPLDKVLRRTGVYSRAIKNYKESDGFSISTRASTAAESWLSGISVSDISNISVVGLPINVKSIYNGAHYARRGFDHLEIHHSKASKPREASIDIISKPYPR